MVQPGRSARTRVAKPWRSPRTRKPLSCSKPATLALSRAASGSGAARLASSLPDRLAASSAAKTRLAAEGFMPRSGETETANCGQRQPHRDVPAIAMMNVREMGGEENHRTDPRDVDRH